MKKTAISLLLVGLSVGSAWAIDIDDRNLSPPQQTLLAAEPHASSKLKVTAWVDHKDNTYVLGDKVQLYVQPNEDAYLIVVTVGPSGEAAVLYPNAIQASAKIPGGKPFAIPGTHSPSPITASAPAGNELIRVIASTTPLDLLHDGELTGEGVFRAVVGGVDTLVRNLSIVPASQERAYYHKTIVTIDKVADTSGSSSQPPSSASSQPDVVSSDIPLGGTGPKAPLLALDKASYKIGDAVELAVSTVSDCYLFVVDVSSDHSAHLLFPNKLMQDNHLAANASVIVSGGSSKVKIVAAGPPGKEAIYAICGSSNTAPWEGGIDLTTMFPPLDTDKGLPKAFVAMEADPVPPSTDYAIASAFVSVTDK